MILIKQAIIKCPDSEFHNQKMDLRIEKGIITAIEKGLDPKVDCELIQKENLHVSLGWMDTSVSFGEPGFEERQTIENGLLAAATGGFTTIALNPNNDPNPESAAGISFLKAKAAGNIVELLPVGNLTLRQEGKHLAELYDMSEAGAVAFYDYKKGLSNANLLKISLQYTGNFGGVVQSFPENKELAGSGMVNEDNYTINLGLKSKDSMAEEIRIARDLAILEYTGGRLHIPCITTAKSARLIQAARDKGLQVTTSVSINNLALDSTSLSDFDTNFKLRPPLRSKIQKNELLDLVKSGAIHSITSDHTPLTIEEKEVEFDHAAHGSVGLESVFPILNKLVDTDKCIELLTGGFEVFNLTKPKIQIDQPANLTLFSTDDSVEINRNTFVSTSKNSASIGLQGKGKIIGILNNGKLHLNE
jgi:dihydroorotase